MQTATLKTARDLTASRTIYGLRNPQGADGFSLYSAEHKNKAGDKLYVVYSYGPHYPLFLYNETTKSWYANTDPASRTTARHRASARPLTELLESSTQAMKAMLE